MDFFKQCFHSLFLLEFKLKYRRATFKVAPSSSQLLKALKKLPNREASSVSMLDLGFISGRFCSPFWSSPTSFWFRISSTSSRINSLEFSLSPLLFDSFLLSLETSFSACISLSFPSRASSKDLSAPSLTASTFSCLELSCRTRAPSNRRWGIEEISLCSKLRYLSLFK